MPKRSQKRRSHRGLIAVAVTALVVVLACAGLVWGLSKTAAPPLPIQERCVAKVGDKEVTLRPSQARWAALIAGVALQKDMGERGAMLGIAAAWQESTLRNLDHGDLDSLGLFQQRPSAGWGQPEDLMDPHYASRTFLTAVAARDDWRTGDPNDVIQAVQRSDVPQGYRKHVDNATTLASVLAGQQGHAFTCVHWSIGSGTAEALETEIRRTNQLPITRDGGTITVTAPTRERAWAVALQGVSATSDYNVREVRIGTEAWRPSSTAPAEWTTTSASPQRETDVVIQVG